MFIFPIIYLLSFLLFIKKVREHNIEGIFNFLIFGLSIYTIALSVTFMYGFPKLIPYMQAFKEVSILIALFYSLYYFNKKIQLHIIDYCMLLFFIYGLTYIFLPIGSYGFFEKVIAFKSLSFFPVVYFAGRFISFEKIHLQKIFYFISSVAVAAAAVLLVEVITYKHLQTISGYADYNSYFFGLEPEGDYGLSWTFQIESGAKRFASFFANPLEHGVATLLALSALLALLTNNKNEIKFTQYRIVIFVATLFSILFALSRAAFVSYFLIIYVYAFITDKKIITKIFHYFFIAAVCFLIFFSIKEDLIAFIIDSIKFSNASSLGHVIEWVNGVNAMIQHPLGMGLGESGRISSFTGSNTGGENEFVIIGVQLGIVGLFIYIFSYIKIIQTSYRIFKTESGKIRRLALFVFLIKIGLLIPLFTSETESYIYITYLTWFLTGMFVNMLVQKSIYVKNGKEN